MPGQDLVGQVVDDEPVAAGERLDEVDDLVRSRSPRSDSAASWRPAIQPSVRSSRASTSAASRSSPIAWLRNCCASSGVKRRSAPRTSTSCPRLRSRASGQRRVGAGGDHQVQLVGAVVEQEGHGLVHLGRRDDVVVVQDEDPLPPRVVFPGSGEGVDQRGQGAAVGVSRAASSRTVRLELESGRLEGRHQVGQEPRQVVVAVVEGQPRRRGRVSLPLTESATQSLSTVVFPNPAGAETSVSRWPGSRVLSRRSEILGRATSCRRRAGGYSLVASTGVTAVLR